MIKIVQKENKVLRQIAEEVQKDDIKSPKIKKILEDMKIALASQDDGVAIAAPQIDIPLRIFVVSGKVHGIINPDEKDKNFPDMVFINPEIVKFSKKREMMEEGCLSERYFYGKVYRFSKATVRALDENGDEFTRGGTGLMAQIFQHEIDHLNGILFSDKSEDLVEIPPEKTQR